MANIGRQIGVNIFTLMQNSDISREEMAEHLGYSTRDINRLIDGRMIISPNELRKIASFLGTSKEELMTSDNDNLIPELQYMKEFKNKDNLDSIMDLLDDYIELKESI